MNSTLSPQKLLEEGRNESPRLWLLQKFESGFDKRQYFCFVEGPDDVSFYDSYLKDKGFTCQFKSANSKYGVVQLCKSLYSPLESQTFNFDILNNRHWLRFFVDRDAPEQSQQHQSIETYPNVFITQYYSFESYLLNKTFIMERLLELSDPEAEDMWNQVLLPFLYEKLGVNTREALLFHVKGKRVRDELCEWLRSHGLTHDQTKMGNLLLRLPCPEDLKNFILKMEEQYQASLA